MSVPSRMAMPGQAARGANPSSPGRRRLRTDMREAVAGGGFSLWVQPRFSLDHGGLTGVEAQTRWPHRASLGTASGFMALARECGLEDSVAAWTLAESCRAAGGWAGAYIGVSVPPPRDAPLLLRQIGAALAESGLPAERLNIEVSPAGLMDAEEDTLLVLAALADRGVGLTLADFGGESADLLLVKRLPLTRLKLDRWLVRDVPQDAAAIAVVRSAVACAHALGVSVLAAGVDTAAQRDFLAVSGCDEAQGSLLGKVAAAADFHVPGMAGGI